MINVLVVEDSAVIREFLVHILESDPDIAVIGTASDGEDALSMVQRRHPDVITMDIHMPKMNGLDATRHIMETNPIPIVIVSGSQDPGEMGTTFDAMNAGALAVLPRPVGMGHPDYEAMARHMVQTVKLMSEVKMVRRWARMRNPAPPSSSPGQAAASTGEQERAELSVVGIGASTGGPAALETILAALPKSFPVPILIVQHISKGFVGGLAQWLSKSSGLPVHVATHGELPLAGHVYIAPDEFHMKVERGGRIILTQDRPEHGLRPSVSCLFRSLHEVYGRDAVAGLLTGMGRDGAEELRQLKEKGAITFAQDKGTSVVHGMPGEAVRLGAATFVLPLEKIAPALINLTDPHCIHGIRRA
jgi:two-component system chemotaxis response regulator CheB